MNVFDAEVRRCRERLIRTKSRVDANIALQRLADIARDDPDVAAVIAERVRADRLQRRLDAQRPFGTTAVVLGTDDLAECVERAGCSSLAPTAILELEDSATPRLGWVPALVATATDRGVAHLTRMRVRRGWSGLAPLPDTPVHGIEALVSPIADIRKPALEALSRTPRPVHLRAFLLATELDRYIPHERPAQLQASAWLPLLGEHARNVWWAGRWPWRVAPEFAKFASTVHGGNMLEKLIESGVVRAPMQTPQHMTPGLQELEREGAAAFAAKYIPDVRLTVDERTVLQDAEMQLVFRAKKWDEPSPREMP